MQLKGRRICIAGSAGNKVDATLLRYAHDLISNLVSTLTKQGALICCAIGKNPHQMDDPKLPALIFDWTVLGAAFQELQNGTCVPDGPQGRLFAAVATSKTASQIPLEQRPLWDQLISSSSLSLQYVEAGWNSGAVRRHHQADLSDILIAISGSEGVEHLAMEFAAQGKPVIPLDLDVGASTHEGPGSAPKLFGRMRNRPTDFVKAGHPEEIGSPLLRMETARGATPVGQVVSAILDLITALSPPDAFYVRLLNPRVKSYKAVERYFRRIVDPVVRDFGYNPVEMGRVKTISPWINVQIFESIHYSAATIVDLTGVRPNCFMELGYAFGREHRVMITAQEGTSIPFDSSPIEVRMWNDKTDDAKRIQQLRDYWKRNVNRQALVQPRKLL